MQLLFLGGKNCSLGLDTSGLVLLLLKTMSQRRWRSLGEQCPNSISFLPRTAMRQHYKWDSSELWDWEQTLRPGKQNSSAATWVCSFHLLLPEAEFAWRNVFIWPGRLRRCQPLHSWPWWNTNTGAAFYLSLSSLLLIIIISAVPATMASRKRRASLSFPSSHSSITSKTKGAHLTVREWSKLGFRRV